MTIIPAQTLAKITGLSVRRLNQLAHEGIIPVAEHGGFEHDASLAGLFEHFRAMAKREPQELVAARARLATARAKKIEKESLSESGEHITRADAERLLACAGHMWATSIPRAAEALAFGLCRATGRPHHEVAMAVNATLQSLVLAVSTAAASHANVPPWAAAAWGRGCSCADITDAQFLERVEAFKELFAAMPAQWFREELADFT